MFGILTYLKIFLRHFKIINKSFMDFSKRFVTRSVIQIKIFNI